jgi:hypothetical protein
MHDRICETAYFARSVPVDYAEEVSVASARKRVSIGEPENRAVKQKKRKAE